MTIKDAVSVEDTAVVDGVPHARSRRHGTGGDAVVVKLADLDDDVADVRERLSGLEARQTASEGINTARHTEVIAAISTLSMAGEARDVAFTARLDTLGNGPTWIGKVIGMLICVNIIAIIAIVALAGKLISLQYGDVSVSTAVTAVHTSN